MSHRPIQVSDRASVGRRLVVTICSRARPDRLRACLTSLFAQQVPVGAALTVVVVENNATPDYTVLMAGISRTAPQHWKLVFAHEPRLGIPQARNRCLELALAENPDWIAFLDDDETVEENWLQNMILAMHELDCDVLQGPVRYVYPDLPSWLVVKSRTNRARGARLRTAYTNNVFMKSSIANPTGLGLRFDEGMRFTGGSDSDYFFRAVDRGATIGWVNDAYVREIVTPTRLTARWQLTRAMRVAANASTIYTKRRGAVSAWRRYAPKALVRIVWGAILIVVGALCLPVASAKSKRLLFAGGKRCASGAGSLTGLCGASPQPYRHVD